MCHCLCYSFSPSLGRGLFIFGHLPGQKIFPASGFGGGRCERLPQGSRVGLETSNAPPCDFPRDPAVRVEASQSTCGQAGI